MSRLPFVAFAFVLSAAAGAHAQTPAPQTPSSGTGA